MIKIDSSEVKLLAEVIAELTLRGCVFDANLSAGYWVIEIHGA